MTQPLTAPEAPSGALVSVVYSSFATVSFSDADLASLLVQSRMSNGPRGITGLLLHRDGQFMQALEGPRTAVRALMSVIGRDLRHAGMWTLDEMPLAQRRFGSWSMGYRDLAHVPGEHLPEWFGSEEGADGPDRLFPPDRAGELLHWFRDR